MSRAYICTPNLEHSLPKSFWGYMQNYFPQAQPRLMFPIQEQGALYIEKGHSIILVNNYVLGCHSYAEKHKKLGHHTYVLFESQEDIRKNPWITLDGLLFQDSSGDFRGLRQEGIGAQENMPAYWVLKQHLPLASLKQKKHPALHIN